MLERRWLVITAFISIFVLSLIYVFKAERIYQATVRLQIDREQDNVLRSESVQLCRHPGRNDLICKRNTRT